MYKLYAATAAWPSATSNQAGHRRPCRKPLPSGSQKARVGRTVI